MKLGSYRRTNRVRKILIAVGIPLGLILIIVGMFALHYFGVFDKFVQKTQRNFDDYVEYNLIAPKDNAEKPAKIETIAYVATDIYAKELETVISDDYLSGTPLSTTDLSALSSAMLAAEFRLALISDDHLNIYYEDSPDFHDWVIVIDRIKIPTTHQNTPEEVADVAQPFAIYISGIDTRQNAFPFAARSDVNIIMVIDPESHQVVSVSTPRDFYVTLHGTGAKDKLTHAGTYGVEMSLMTLEDFYEIDIAYYVRTNFNSLIKVVSTLGGVSVESDRDFVSHDGYTFKKGINHLNGKQALAYARERKAFPEGDRMRGVHQQQIIEAIMGKLLKTENLSRVEELLDTLGDSFQTNMPADQIRSLAFDQLNSASDWTTKTLQVNGTGDSRGTYSTGAQKVYVMQPDMATVETARTALKSALKTN